MHDLKPFIDQAVEEGNLLQSSAENMMLLLTHGTSPIYEQTIHYLVVTGEWAELNDRFYKTLAFGTGGLRGRTIGKIVTKAERGEEDRLGRPQHPCVGTNAMNFFNVSRATQGLVAYLKEWFRSQGRSGRPKLAVAYDTRHFSQEFAEVTARVAMENGCDVCLFKGARSTPELSFAVRYTGSNAGIVVTASHNPSHDNGYKVYFEDGGQVVEPHASAIIAKVNAIESDVFDPVAEEEQGQLQVLGAEIDEAYMDRLQTLVLDPQLVKQQKQLRIVFTSIHGTGGIIILPMLKRLGFKVSVVPEQEVADGRFPTVKSPNPENAEALKMAMELAEKEGADLVMATDPDCDRMGVAARDAAGALVLLSGNQIGSLMAYYRAKTLFAQGVLTPENAHRGVIIKTFVTTDLQKAIANKFGLRCVETLTGFKYIGEKLTKYEKALPPEAQQDYARQKEEQTREQRLRHSSFYVFGGEESYGYSGADFVRDKDANGSAVMFAEVAAYAKSRGLTLVELLDEIYSEFGFYLEKNGSMTFEGAEGADKIKRLIDSYGARPPEEIGGIPVKATRDFARERITDVEGDIIPAEKMLMFELEGGGRVAVRPSGTEPKIKFYMFASRAPAEGRAFSREELAEVKQQVAASLDELWNVLQEDVSQRLS